MMCNFKTCFWEVFKFTSNFIYNMKNVIHNFTPNEMSIVVHNKFIEVRNKNTYYIYKGNNIVKETSLLTLTNIEQLNKITTNFFLPYVILYYKNKTYNLELQGPEYTFYIEGNKINRDLIEFYMKTKENITLTDEDQYSIEILDSDLKPKIINDNMQICFEKETYKLI